MSERAVALALAARFVDEVLSGAFSVLAPTFRRTFGLSLVAVSLLDQVLFWVALIVEPPAALLIDVRSRRGIMVFGAAWLALAMILMGIAPTYVLLLAGFAAYGVGSGPLADSADIVLVESHPDQPEEAFARGTFFDTIGAMLAPALIAGAAWTGVSWRVVLVTLGAATLLYVYALARTPMPSPSRAHVADGELHLLAELRSNLRDVFTSPTARRWLLFGLWFNLVEAPHALKYVWLNEQVGLSQGGVALYAVGENAVGLAALLLIERRLARVGARRMLLGACVALLVLFPAWVLAPGLVPRLVLGVPLAFAHALVWPLSRTRALVSVPGRAGAVSAVNNLLGVLPLPILFGVTAEWLGLTRAIVVVSVAGTALMLATAVRDRSGGEAAPVAREE